MRGLSEVSGRSSDDVLRAACNRNPRLSVTVRRYRRRKGGQPHELVAEWGVEDKLSGGAGLLGSVRIENTKAAYVNTRSAEHRVGGQGIPVYLCEYADVSKVIGVPSDAKLAKMSKMPTHPWNKYDYDFERLKKLPPGVPVLRLFLTLYINSFGARTLEDIPLNRWNLYWERQPSYVLAKSVK